MLANMHTSDTSDCEPSARRAARRTDRRERALRVCPQQRADEATASSPIDSVIAVAGIATYYVTTEGYVASGVYATAASGERKDAPPAGMFIFGDEADAAADSEAADSEAASALILFGDDADEAARMEARRARLAWWRTYTKPRRPRHTTSDGSSDATSNGPTCNPSVHAGSKADVPERADTTPSDTTAGAPQPAA